MNKIIPYFVTKNGRIHFDGPSSDVYGYFWVGKELKIRFYPVDKYKGLKYIRRPAMYECRRTCRLIIKTLKRIK